MFLLLQACSETGIEKIDPDAGITYTGDIVVEPAELSFDALEPGQSATQSFTILNEGDAALAIENIQLEGTTAFSFTGETAFTLEPQASREVAVNFTPVNVEDSARIHVSSDDPDEATVEVGLSGLALVPELLIYPDPLDLGNVPVGCETASSITLSNVGLADLVISGLVEVGEGFVATLPELPTTLAPGASVDLPISFVPAQLETSSGELWITSNDLRGTVIHNHWGTGSNDEGLSEDFRQGDGPWDRADVLMYVDNSGSMSDDQENVADNIDILTTALSTLEIDWQLMAAIDDSGCHSGAIWNPDDVPSSTEFLSAIRGVGGNFTEAGLSISRNALEQSYGGCNDGFLREDSKTTLVLVSDEPEQSPEGYFDVVEEIQELAPTAAVDVIVGDFPEGCETAYPGDGYVQAAALTGGIFLSICDNDWGNFFDSIATQTSSGVTDTFVLANHPAPETISVTVDGAASTAWVYDEDLNAIVFEPDGIPVANAYIEVDYRFDADCDA